MTADLPAGWITPDWPAPAGIKAFITTRAGGVSSGPHGLSDGRAGGMNLGYGSQDEVAAVDANRALLRQWLPAEPRWLKQVHGAEVVEAEEVREPVAADAATALKADVVCAVLVADCMPVLLVERRGRAVGVAHAGWRGLAAGVLQKTVRQLRSRLNDARADIIAYLGPCIGPTQFEVGSDVLSAMQKELPDAGHAFLPHPLQRGDKWLANLPLLARQALALVRVHQVFGGEDCTATDAQRFYSFRRDGITGRHAAVIWREIDESMKLR